MTPATLEALNKSIAHWEEMSRTGWAVEQPEANQCALCKLFILPDGMPYKAYCKGCPVFERTGLTHCIETPYTKAFRAYDDGYGDPAAFKLAAQAELEFLRSLLPTKHEGGVAV